MALKNTPGQEHRSHSMYIAVLYSAAFSALALLLGLLLTLIVHAFPAIQEFGTGFLFGSTWDPVTGEYGALPFLAGTLITSSLALLIAIPFSLAISILLGEFYKIGKLSAIVTIMVELLAGIPSVIYGFWGLFFLVPLIRSLEMKIGVAPYGVGVLTSSVILAVMIIPYSASLGREVISMVPGDLKEAAYSLGATRYEVIKKVIVPFARSGIFAGIILAFSRALGETMAVTMVIGNANVIPTSIFSPGNTMASVIANEFAEATDAIYLSALVEIALLLLLVTMIINILGKTVINRLGVS